MKDKIHWPFVARKINENKIAYSLMWASFLAKKSQTKSWLTTTCWMEDRKKMTAAHKKTGSHLAMSSFLIRVYPYSALLGVLKLFYTIDKNRSKVQ